jgi:hypothetical protein
MENLLIDNQIIETVDEHNKPIKIRFKITETKSKQTSSKHKLIYEIFDSEGRYFKSDQSIIEFENIKNVVFEIEVRYSSEYNFDKRMLDVWIDVFINKSLIVILNESDEYNLNQIQNEIDQYENIIQILKEKKQIYENLFFSFDV